MAFRPSTREERHQRAAAEDRRDQINFRPRTREERQQRFRDRQHRDRLLNEARGYRPPDGQAAGQVAAAQVDGDGQDEDEDGQDEARAADDQVAGEQVRQEDEDDQEQDDPLLHPRPGPSGTRRTSEEPDVPGHVGELLHELPEVDKPDLLYSNPNIEFYGSRINFRRQR